MKERSTILTIKLSLSDKETDINKIPLQLMIK